MFGFGFLHFVLRKEEELARNLLPVGHEITFSVVFSLLFFSSTIRDQKIIYFKTVWLKLLLTVSIVHFSQIESNALFIHCIALSFLKSVNGYLFRMLLTVVLIKIYPFLQSTKLRNLKAFSLFYSLVWECEKYLFKKHLELPLRKLWELVLYKGIW